MKKALLVVAAMVVSAMVLVGCGEKDVQGSVAPKETQEVQTDQAQTMEETTTESTTEDSYVSLGGFDGGVYTNKYVGIGCNLDENWQFYSAEELQELPGAVKELLEGSDISEYLDENTVQIMDMKAENVNDLTTINLVLTRLSFQERLAYKLMTEEETVDETLKMSDMMISSYAQAGMDVTEMEKVMVTFLGEEHAAIKTSCKVGDVDQYLLQFFFYQKGSYGATLTLTSYVEDRTEDLAKLFYVVE